MTKLKINTVEEAKQAAFNGAVRGLAFQGWKQCRNLIDRSCSWNQGNPGMHCAVGWLVPWENQKDVKTGAVFRATQDQLLHPDLNSWTQDIQFAGFLVELQGTHDSLFSMEPKGMKENFAELAKREGLSWPKDVAL